jgi:hypothetical protein
MSEHRYKRGDLVVSRRSGRVYSITDDNGGPYVRVYEPNSDWSSSVTIHRHNLRPHKEAEL